MKKRGKGKEREEGGEGTSVAPQPPKAGDATASMCCQKQRDNVVLYFGNCFWFCSCVVL